MPTPNERESDQLKAIERMAEERLAEESGHVEAELEATPDTDEDELPEAQMPLIRVAIAVGAPTIGAAVMAGGVFNGVSPRFYAAAGGLLGMLLAFMTARIRRSWLAYALIAVGLFVIGIVVVIPSGFDNLVNLRTLVGAAAKSSKILRPPIDLTPGWIAILGWIMGTVGFAPAWTALVIRKPSLSLLLPLPVAGIAAISVPKGDAQVISGIVVFVLFAIGLGALSGIQRGGTDERLPVGYEIRRALKALPILIVGTVGLYFAATQASFLFPHPIVDPTLTPQQPHAIPLSQVQDRILFEVKSSITGPWVLGTLDVYDQQDGTWRLPPFAENKLAPVPSSGVVDSHLQPGVRAEFTIQGLGGAVLPGLPNTVGIIESGPQLDYDARSGNIRVVQGQVEPGFHYIVGAAVVPSISDLRALTRKPGKDIVRFTDMPPPPPVVRDLLGKAPHGNKWDEFDYLRTYILQNVTASGPGTPVAIPPSRVQEILSSDKKEASPFEIVAMQVMLARWAGVPARIAYGFDGGVKAGDKLQVHPNNGTAFPEVYFQGYDWLPVIGTPAKAKVTQGGDPRLQQQRSDIAPSSDISVPIFMPAVEPPESLVYEQLRTDFLIGVPILLLLAALYFTYPLVRKAVRLAQRRSLARAGGPRARVVQAYAEWRDTATDYGYGHQADTPIMFLRRFVPDADHTELAWLLTRALWGDLKNRVTDDLAADAEEYSRVLKRRIAAAHPITVRAIAAMSRLSLRHPFDERTLAAVSKEVESASQIAA